MEKCTSYEQNKNECPCQNMECERRGICCDCIRHHRKRGSTVACMRPPVIE